MEFSKVIEDRRSVRKYTDETISKETIAEIINAAQLAPSWKNSQTARYYVATGEMVNEVRTKCLPEFNQNNTVNAPALVITTFVANRSGFTKEGAPENEIGNEWGAFDLGLACENIVLKSKDLGYDTLIMGIRDEKALRSVAQIPDSEHVVAVIAIGKRAADPVMPPRKEMEAIVKYL